MKFIFRSGHPLLKIVSGSLYDLPSPSSLSYLWSFGSLLGLCLGIQLVSGVLVAMHYVGGLEEAFSSVVHLMRDVESGWLLRFTHANGASLFFVLVYLHIGRGIYFSSYSLGMVWSTGLVIFLLMTITAFLGYVLPWGQMSFWGATVITNLLSAVPYVGTMLVEWLWGGFSVGGATLTRFLSLHYLLPFLLAALILVHLLFLHGSGSSNPLGISLKSEKLNFSFYFVGKDVVGFATTLILFFLMISWAPLVLGDPENFSPANPLSTPVHIQPEWYFLFVYAILRSIPNKLGGVIALLMAIVIFFFFVLLGGGSMWGKSNFFYKFMFWMLVNCFLLLTWIGANPVEPPYLMIGMILSLVYFLIVLTMLVMCFFKNLFWK